MTTATMEVLQGKYVKEGTYTSSLEFMDFNLQKGKSLWIHDAEGTAILTSRVQGWIFFEGGMTLVITMNSAYIVMFK